MIIVKGIGVVFATNAERAAWVTFRAYASQYDKGAVGRVALYDSGKCVAARQRGV